MATITCFEEIEGWQIARELANLIYDWSGQGDFARDFGLRDQMRRAIVSVMSNIAEGFESQTQRLFIAFLGRARGSCGEVRAQLYMALDRGYISEAQFQKACTLAKHCSGKIFNFMEYLKQNPDMRRIKEIHIEYAT